MLEFSIRCSKKQKKKSVRGRGKRKIRQEEDEIKACRTPDMKKVAGSDLSKVLRWVHVAAIWLMYVIAIELTQFSRG